MLGEVKDRIAGFAQDEAGASMIEYILLVALIALVALGAFKVLGHSVSNTATNAGAAMNGQ